MHFLQIQMDIVTRCYDEYNTFQNLIHALPLSDNLRTEHEEKYVEFESLYTDTAVRLSTLIERATKPVPAPVPNASAVVLRQAERLNLPALQVPLPTFDGSYEYSFKAMFTTIMNRYQHEEPALKLYHLRRCLVDKAEGIIDQEIIDNNDYDAAWLLLKQQYEDKRIIVDKHVDNLFNLPRISQESATNMRKMINVCTKNVEALKKQNLLAVGLGEQMLVNLIAAKMDKKLRVAWEARQKKDVLSTYDATMEFLQEQCRIYEKFDTKPATESAKPKAVARSHTLVTSETKSELKCAVCKANHELWKCDAFKQKSVSDKYEVLKKCGACFNCLARGHRTRACSSRTCQECGRKHHTLLHTEDTSSQTSSSATSTKPAEVTTPVVKSGNQVTSTPAGTSTTLCASAVSADKQTLLSTAVVLVDGVGSTPYPCRVLLDSASQMNFVTDRFANLLSLRTTRADFTVSGLNGNKTRICRKLRTTVKSRLGDFSASLDLLVTPRITGDLPVKSFDVTNWPITNEMALADPTFNRRGRVDMLIGAEYFWTLLEDDRLELGPNLPVLRNTKLGWIAGGVVASDAPVVARTFCQTADDEPLIELLKSFYKVEACDEFRPSATADDEVCLEHFRRTHERNEEGRYVVRHPFNERKLELGDSREMALRRFLALERKLDKQPELKEQYSQFIREYAQLGHMREIEEKPNEDPGAGFYLPHHCVLRPTICLTLDIPKMFRQVGVHPEDTKYQRIFWRYDRNDLLSVWELQTVTYGLGPSPFQATMALKQAAADHQDEFPRAAEVVEKGTYMDDILTGADTLEEACELQREVTGLLAKACFSAHKWCANHSDIVRAVPEELRGNSFEVTDDNAKTTVKTLGVTWNSIEDWFSVSVPDFDELDEMTRRKLLSQLAKIFDPLGFFGPVITYVKLILREVGELQIEWDDPVPPDVGSKWRNFRIEMTALREVRLPRWISWKGALKLELHGYADASDLAYGACLHVEGFFADGKTEMRLIYSKSRILPKKRKAKEKAISTPRAELLAALLLARMVVKFLSATELKFAAVHLWSDSKIVLAWLRKLPHLLQTFVSNRVSEIQRLTENFFWHYIPSEENPADLISRGVRPKKLMTSKKWWRGPPRTPVVETGDELEIPDEELPEMRAGVALAMTVPVERFPMFDKETRAATLVIVRLVQRETFQPEILALMDGAETKHRLCGLNAFLDSEDGILRVGGRIKRAVIPYDSRHQMLLPAKHPITEALVRELHLDNLHIGQKGLLAIVRQRYWPLNVKNTIRKVIRNCVRCFKANPLKTTQMMGDLPSYRIRPAPVFSTTGVDYAGPFWIKSSSATRKPQVTKAYVSLFVCMQTRAIHLELVSDLTTDAFLAALRRFTSRRGCPRTMRSDNATNFAGAKNELNELWRLLQDQRATKKIASYCTDKGIEWSFIPPRSPHFGGIWEAGVKQVKHHLKRIVGDRKLSYEELYTTLTQIEAVLNSRPLAPVSDDPNDYTAITPAHFLIGREMQAVAEPDYTDLKENRLSRWQLVQTMLQHFWKRWTAEYLPELQQRTKWLKTKQIKEGSLVLLVDHNAPPLQWPLGRIVATHPGDDGVTRVVTVKTANGGEFKRAVTEICLLPLE
ncbi:uncharacterized protein LOC120417801 [Culex pipiens pallens]|uniref:uncharacterized protein LOC120417801 n=1 Tax=Culex pipiens pallens TaxID=42434 RepID=UPI0022AA45FC|nr:uncharacterized protein LOC120417801 [Culex pipiens pallens]